MYEIEVANFNDASELLSLSRDWMIMTYEFTDNQNQRKQLSI